jgi:hypothetical protein
MAHVAVQNNDRAVFKTNLFRVGGVATKNKLLTTFENVNTSCHSGGVVTNSQTTVNYTIALQFQ